ncbi:MAG: FeoB-associated Cys-rich membrane protein [Duncaniella sp.]|nr:FeoB-associated Cys-rich membrane protein [Duncaniella sp.]
MNSIIQTVIAVAIVLAAVAYAVVRFMRHRSDDACDSCDGCPLMEKCDKPRNTRRL